MKQSSRKYQESDFEGDGFIEECLQAFDEGVEKIEAEYAVTNKSA